MNSTPRLLHLCFLLGGLVLLALPGRAQSTNAPAAAAPAPAAAADASKLDFGDFSSSAITNKAWAALEAKDYAAVKGYTDKCIETFESKAIEQQGTLKAPAPKDNAFDYWALNDVGTCYFIKGKALDAQGDKKGAIAAYKTLVDKLGYAQCWDPKGWFWSPADAAKKRLAELQFDAE